MTKSYGKDFLKSKEQKEKEALIEWLLILKTKIEEFYKILEHIQDESNKINLKCEIDYLHGFVSGAIELNKGGDN